MKKNLSNDTIGLPNNS